MCFLYKDKSVDLRQIGREFNVRYVLEGSVQRVGARMRVNVQLIEAESGAHLWAKRFDKPIAASSRCKTRSFRASLTSLGMNSLVSSLDGPCDRGQERQCWSGRHAQTTPTSA
jgi:hypothetical protein